jgi:GTPase SAR1 family protein
MVESNVKKDQMKIVLLGDAGVGKTTLINQFTSGTNEGATLTAEFQKKEMTVGDTEYLL